MLHRVLHTLKSPQLCDITFVNEHGRVTSAACIICLRKCRTAFLEQVLHSAEAARSTAFLDAAVGSLVSRVALQQC